MLNKNNTLINIFACVGFTLVCLPWMILPFFRIFYSVAELTEIFGFAIIIAILSFSINRIRKFSKMLVQNKIFANECLMITHLASFTFLGIILIITYTITMILGENYRSTEMTVSEERLAYMSVICEYLISLGCFAVIATMVVMFLKHS